MTNLRPFQLVLLAIFGVSALLSVLLISNYQSRFQAEQHRYGSSVIIWGTLDRSAFERVFRDISDADNAFRAVEYVQKDAFSFDLDLVNAIAEGRGPDLILLRADSLVKHRNKLLPLSYETFPIRDIRSTYVDAAEIFALSDGFYALPLAVDPLVMYWNRDLFASNGLAEPPRTWEEIVNVTVPALTRRGDNRSILRSAVAFGEFGNITHARRILLALTLQSGGEMISETDNRYTVGLNRSAVGNQVPLESAAQFFTSFSNPSSPTYSWNRAQFNDANVFSAGDLGVYFGLGSEAETVEERNPNLNFDIEVIPQGASATLSRTYGDVYGLAILRASQNPSGAYAAAGLITGGAYAPPLARALAMAPARRAALSQQTGNRFEQVRNQSALYARSWLDPDPSQSNAIFSQMIEDVVSNRSRLTQAVNDAVGRLRLLF